MKKHFKILVTVFATLLCACSENTPNGPNRDVNETHDESGMYVGITGFSDNVEFFNSASNRFVTLSTSNSAQFTSFINSLSMGDATVLYYAVDNNLDYLAKCSFPGDLTSVNVITFTDGLNQGSRALDKQDGNHEYAANDNSYVSAISEKLKDTKIGGLPITAYSIGIRGKDVQGDAITTFRDNLKKLSSSQDNAMEVSNMDEVSAKFKEIAESLYKKSESKDLTITIPMPSENEKERFTFDNVSDASASKCYLEGVYANGALTNIKYVGCMSNSGSEVKERSAGGVKISFDFVNFTDESGNAVSTTKMQQWHMESGQKTWTRNSEFKPTESIIVHEERKTAVVMLILDCSSSLGSDFSKVKLAANNFIKTLAGEVNGSNPTPEPEPEPEPTPEDPTPEPEPTSLSYVRFQKEYAYLYIPIMSIESYDDDFYWIETVAEHAFGEEAGISSYYEIPSGKFYPMYYYYDEDNTEESGYYPGLDEPYTYNFLAGKKYTYTCSDDGEYLIFTITLDGNAKAPAKVVSSRRVAKSKLAKQSRVHK